MAARTSSVPSPRTGMFRVRFTLPVVDSSHGLACAKRLKTHKGNQICMTTPRFVVRTTLAVAGDKVGHRPQGFERRARYNVLRDTPKVAAISAIV